MTDTQSEYEELLQPHDQTKRKTDLHEIEQIRKATDNAKAQFENEKETVMSSYNKLEKSVIEYHSRLFGSEITNSNGGAGHGTSKIILNESENFARNYSSESMRSVNM